MVSGVAGLGYDLPTAELAARKLRVIFSSSDDRDRQGIPSLLFLYSLVISIIVGVAAPRGNRF